MAVRDSQKALQLRLVAPDRTLLDEAVDMVVFRTQHGDMGVLPNHEPCAVMLDTGIMRVFRGGKEEQYLVHGGFALVDRRSVVVLSELAERADRMEALLADLEQQRLRRKRDSQRWEDEIVRAEAAIRRVLITQELSAYSVLQNRGDEGQALEGLDDGGA